eukprot:jgi/Phyca11/537309/estExt2_fgenesh1_pg.C_PHYCAscaffold_830013
MVRQVVMPHSSAEEEASGGQEGEKDVLFASFRRHSVKMPVQSYEKENSTSVLLDPIFPSDISSDLAVQAVFQAAVKSIKPRASVHVSPEIKLTQATVFPLKPSDDADATPPFPSLPPVPEVEELTPPKLKQIVDLRDTSHADLARMGFTDSHYDAAVASGSMALVDVGDETQQQLVTRSRLASYASSSGDGYTLEEYLRRINEQMKRVMAFCETQRENPLRLQAKINDLQEQLRQAITEKNYWMKRCKDLTGHQPPAAEVSKVDLHEAELVDNGAIPRSCFRLLQCSDEQCEVFTPMNRSIRTLHRSRNNVQLMWDEPPKTVLVVKKPNEPDTTKMLVRLAPWLHKEKKIDIYLEPSVHEELTLPDTKTWGSKPQDWEECQSKIDFVISLGGDGTVLWVSSLFKKSVPPVFSL